MKALNRITCDCNSSATSVKSNIGLHQLSLTHVRGNTKQQAENRETFYNIALTCDISDFKSAISLSCAALLSLRAVISASAASSLLMMSPSSELEGDDITDPTASATSRAVHNMLLI